ncbi:MAG: rhamnulokinase [Acetivibrionales bacterium]|jgi:rhamnulokinase
MLKLVAFDYGASSGRAMLGSYDGSKLTLREIHRFANIPVMVGETLYWDILRLFHEMKQGLLECMKSGNSDIAGIGVDTWGVDFGLLGPSGELLGNVVHYRDKRNEGMIEEASKIVPKREIYEKTGIQFLKFNSLYQLLSIKLNNPYLLETAETMLFTPDLLNYFLTGEKLSEYTIASTSQMINPVERDWARDLLRKLGIPEKILTEIINPGTVVGRVRESICSELNMKKTPVIAVAGHDTGSAVISVPALEGKYAYLSSGTWSLLGVESPLPVINNDTYCLNYTNEGGLNNTRLLKNIMGLWIYQECKRAWDKQGEAMGFDELEAAAEKAKAFVSFIDPDDDLFYSPGHMPEKVQEFCRRTGQTVPEGKAAIVRCIMESLALKYRHAIEGLEKVLGYRLPVLHVVGGGCKNIMLCRFTANSINRPVIAGPVEATSIGNLVCQLIALGEVTGIKQAREVVRESFPVKEYLPDSTDAWDEAYGRFMRLTGNN